jgi:hypothetical protein
LEEQQKAGTTEIPKCGQLQNDTYNCGVLSLISFFRGIRMLDEPGRTEEVTAAAHLIAWQHSGSIQSIQENLLKLILSKISDRV